MLKFTVALVAGLLVAGCQTTQPSESTAPIDDRSAASGSATPGASTAGAGAGGVSGRGVASAPTDAPMNPLRDPANILSKRSVFFDFDSFVVKDEYRPLVEAHARYLAANRSARSTIQGHTDERGSREYNIALGQRRADAIKRMMTLVGAQDGQIETVSFGEERPRSPGSEEGAWAQNRRGDILYAGE